MHDWSIPSLPVPMTLKASTRQSAGLPSHR